MNKLNKPVSLIRDELMNEIIMAINKSNLSYFLLEYIFRDLLSEIHNGAVKQAQVEQAEYQQKCTAAQSDVSATEAHTEDDGSVITAN